MYLFCNKILLYDSNILYFNWFVFLSLLYLPDYMHFLSIGVKFKMLEEEKRFHLPTLPLLNIAFFTALAQFHCFIYHWNKLAAYFPMTWNMLKQRFEIKRWYTILLNRLCFYLRLIFCLDDEKFYVEHILYML